MWEDEREERSRDTWWWNKNVKEVIARKKDAHKETKVLRRTRPGTRT